MGSPELLDSAELLALGFSLWRWSSLSRYLGVGGDLVMIESMKAVTVVIKATATTLK